MRLSSRSFWAKEKGKRVPGIYEQNKRVRPMPLEWLFEPWRLASLPFCKA